MKKRQDAKTIDSSDGVKVHYWVNWKPEMNKSFVVMHPGASMNHSSLQGIERGLNERGHPTLLFDQRGIGYSEAPAKQEYYSLEKYSADLQRIIEKEGLENPDLFAHSFGFMVAIDYLSRTGNLGKITAACASHNFSETTNPLLFHIGGKILGCFNYLTWAANLMSNQITGEKIDYSEQDLAGKSDLSVVHALVNVPFKELRVYRANSGLAKWDISEKLKQVTNPLQLVYGKQDLMVRPYAGEKIARLVKGKCDIHVVEGTHTLPLTHPERVLEVMND